MRAVSPFPASLLFWVSPWTWSRQERTRGVLWPRSSHPVQPRSAETNETLRTEFWCRLSQPLTESVVPKWSVIINNDQDTPGLCVASFFFFFFTMVYWPAASASLGNLSEMRDLSTPCPWVSSAFSHDSQAVDVCRPSWWVWTRVVSPFVLIQPLKELSPFPFYKGGDWGLTNLTWLTCLRSQVISNYAWIRIQARSIPECPLLNPSSVDSKILTSRANRKIQWREGDRTLDWSYYLRCLLRATSEESLLPSSKNK